MRRFSALLLASSFLVSCGDNLVGSSPDAKLADGPVTDARMGDAPMTDGPIADAPMVDAPVVDAPVTDAAVDAPADAMLDASPDSMLMPDAMVDAGADARVDAMPDAMVDAAADAMVDAAPDAPVAPFMGAMPIGLAQDPLVIDDDPTLTADLLELYFNRLGDVYVARRTAVGAAFSTPVRVNEVSRASDETRPEITGDGLYMLVASDRPGGVGGHDIWMSSRASR